MPHFVQSVLVPRHLFSIEGAADWVTKHGYHVTKIDTARNFYRFRQASPHRYAGGRYVTQRLPNGVELVLYYY
jgi:hypothetical protein